MKAVGIYMFGNSNVLQLIDVPVPKFNHNQVLVKIMARSINSFDCKFRKRGYENNDNIIFPLILGMDFSGVVVETGKDVSSLKVNDKVYGFSSMQQMGTYAEYIAIEESQIGIMPKNMSYIIAASLPVVATTAILSFHFLKNIANKNVLINGASGGVGHIISQIAKNFGAIVYGTCSNKNITFLKSLGVTHPLDYNTTNIEDLQIKFDVIFDIVGGSSLEVLYGIMEKDGTLICIASQPDYNRAIKNQVNAYFIWADSKTQLMDLISKMYEENIFYPQISKTYTLAEVDKAHNDFENNHNPGKILLI
jgi:NADPH:quinone reductase-like Zn-dependent oxidoreductase